MVEIHATAIGLKNIHSELTDLPAAVEMTVVPKPLPSQCMDLLLVIPATNLDLLPLVPATDLTTILLGRTPERLIFRAPSCLVSRRLELFRRVLGFIELWLW